MTKVYCDTCIYIDALGLSQQKDRIRPLGEFAWQFFQAISRDKLELITSDWLFKEFKDVIGSDEKLRDFIIDLELGDQRIHLVATEEDEKEARRLSKRNYPDALHVVLAKRAGALFLTTQNIKDFIEFDEYMKKHGIELKQPQDFI
jgi:predicted nucleic acid-binding protein